MSLPRLALLLSVVLVSLAMVLVSGADHVSGWFAGEGTQYTLSHPTNGNCNFMAFPSAATTKYAALNAPQFKSTVNCGRCAEVSCVDAKCQGAAQRTETVYIVDQCPECVRGDLDLSPDVFKSITGHHSDRVQIQWKFVDCPVQGPLQFCLKAGSNPFWTAIQPTNFLVGIQSMEVNGQPTSMVDSAFYFLRDGKSATQTDLSSLQLKITSVNGEVIEETVSLANGGCVDSKFQFTKGRAPDSAADFVDDATPRPTTPAPVPTPSPSTAAPTTAPVQELSTEGSGSASSRLRGTVKTPTGENEDAVMNTTPSATPAATANAAPVVRQVTTRADDIPHATSPALLVLLVLACTCIVVLVVLAVVVKHKRRLKRESEAKHDVDHVSQLPPLIVKQNSYEELATPSRRADIAVL